jgi:DNA-binding transcriptional LysR family regulator
MIDELKAFVAVVEEQSITKAAERLNLTQSGVSRRLQQLETLMDTVLLDRSSRPPRPTLLGQRVYQHALSVLNNLDSLIEIAKPEAEPAGAFCLGISHALSEAISPQIARTLSARYPAVEIKLITGWSAALGLSIANRELDAAIALYGKGDIQQSAQARHIGKINVLVVQSRRHPIVRSRTSIEQLGNYSWVLNPLGCGYRAELERRLGATGRTLKIGVDTHGAELQLNMVASGIGLGLAPSQLIQSSSLRDELTVVDVTGFSLELEVWLLRQATAGNLQQAIELVSDVAASVFSGVAKGERARCLDATVPTSKRVID